MKFTKKFWFIKNQLMSNHIYETIENRLIMVDDTYSMKIFPILVSQVFHQNMILSMYKYVLNHLFLVQHQKHG